MRIREWVAVVALACLTRVFVGADEPERAENAARAAAERVERTVREFEERTERSQGATEAAQEERRAAETRRATEARRESAARREAEEKREANERREVAERREQAARKERDAAERRAREVRDGRGTRSREQREEKLRHLLTAADHLQEAGLEPMADELRRLAGRIREEHVEALGEHPRDAHDRSDTPPPAAELRELHGQIERLTREMNELRQFVRQISERLPERRAERNE